MPMHVCIHTYLHAYDMYGCTHTYMYAYIYIHSNTHACILDCLATYIHGGSCITDTGKQTIMLVFLNTLICACMHTYTHWTHRDLWMDVYMCTYIFTWKHVCIHSCMSAYIQTYFMDTTCVCIHTYIIWYTQGFMHVCLHINIHINMQTCMHTPVNVRLCT